MLRKHTVTTMFLLFLIILSVLVFTIALVTAKFNVKPPCDHNWVEDDYQIKCTKCFRATTKVRSTARDEQYLSKPVITTSKGVPLAYDDSEEMEDALLID